MERSPIFIGMTTFVLAATVALAGCTTTGDAPAIEEPIVVEVIVGTEISRLTLTERAAERLDIRTDDVESAGGGRVVPSAAVIIGTSGTYWVYTNPEPFVFIRQEIRPVHEEDHQAFFDVGPKIGMAVVTTGVPELYGAEFGIGR